MIGVETTATAYILFSLLFFFHPLCCYVCVSSTITPFSSQNCVRFSKKMVFILGRKRTREKNKKRKARAFPRKLNIIFTTYFSFENWNLYPKITVYAFEMLNKNFSFVSAEIVYKDIFMKTARKKYIYFIIMAFLLYLNYHYAHISCTFKTVLIL